MKIRNRFVLRILVFLRSYISLDKEKEHELEIKASILRSAEFKGTNLWVLIFAVFLASIGLNVNSTAVIIGAMLISPLMGPIMAIGLSIGIYDFELLKKAARSFLVSVSFSIATATLYFFITPLTDAQSELLARTTPTIWDVFIALFGGLAGIVASSSRSKGNVIPGVAIATALMPPLCTAGYGIATGNMYFFIGALYLFFINSVFICLATFVIVRFLKFKPHAFMNRDVELKIKRYIYIVVAITVIPSIFMGYGIVTKSYREQNARLFIKNEVAFPGTYIVSRNIDMKSKNGQIELGLMGKYIEADLIALLENKLPQYNLYGTKLNIIQGLKDSVVFDVNTLKTSVLQDLYADNKREMYRKEVVIDSLERKLLWIKQSAIPLDDIAQEAVAIFPGLKEFSVFKGKLYKTETNVSDTVAFAFVSFKNKTNNAELNKISVWVKARLKVNTVKVINE